MKKISVDGIDYALDDLSKDSKQLVANLAATDQEIKRQQFQLMLAQTARAAMVAALKTTLPKAEGEKALD